MSAHVLLNLLSELRKRDKMQGLPSILSFFRNKFNNSIIQEHKCYSPAAIIRNAKIGNIILLHAFFRTLSSNLDLKYPAVSEKNCLKNLLPLP